MIAMNSSFVSTQNQGVSTAKASLTFTNLWLYKDFAVVLTYKSTTQAVTEIETLNGKLNRRMSSLYQPPPHPCEPSYFQEEDEEVDLLYCPRSQIRNKAVFASVDGILPDIVSSAEMHFRAPGQDGNNCIRKQPCFSRLCRESLIIDLHGYKTAGPLCCLNQPPTDWANNPSSNWESSCNLAFLPLALLLSWCLRVLWWVSEQDFLSLVDLLCCRLRLDPVTCVWPVLEPMKNCQYVQICAYSWSLIMTQLLQASPPDTR